MDISAVRRTAMTAFCLLFLAAIAQAEFQDKGSGFYFDLPEGYVLKTSDGKSKFVYAGPQPSATFNVASYPGATYASADAIVRDVKGRLGAEFTEKRVRFQGRDARYAEVSFKLSGVSMRGYGFFVDGLKGENDFALLSVADAKAFPELKLILLSALDSFSIDRTGLRLPGPVSWSEHPFDGGTGITASFQYGGAALGAPTRPGWETGSKALVDREYAVLAAYADSEAYWEKAWIRFYRMIFRDSYSRLDSFSFALGIRMDELWRAGKLQGVGGRVLEAPAGLEAVMGDELKVEALMAILQSHTYRRDPKGSDFTAPLSALLKKEGDCDARAMLAAIILQHWNIEAGMMVSREYSHALGLAAIPGVPGRNAGIELGGRRYLVMETTTAVLPGFIAEEQSAIEHWTGIGFIF